MQDIAHLVASTAARFVLLFFAQQDSIPCGREAIRVSCQVTAVGAYSMYFGDVFGDSQQLRDGAKGASAEVHIEACYDDAHPVDCQLLAYIRQFHVKKLRLIDAYDVDLLGEAQELSGVVDRCGKNKIGVVGNDLDLIVAVIDARFENFDPLVGNFCPFQPADELFCFSGKHRPADDLDPSAALAAIVWFQKHALTICYLLRYAVIDIKRY